MTQHQQDAIYFLYMQGLKSLIQWYWRVYLLLFEKQVTGIYLKSDL